MINQIFRRMANAASGLVGSPWAFLVALLVVILWVASGPLFNFSDTWQLVINTATTIITFLMVFLIQNTQNRDAKAIHLKLDELIRAVEGTRKGLVDLEGLTDEELEQLQNEFQMFRERYAPMNERVIERVDENASSESGTNISYSFPSNPESDELGNVSSTGTIPNHVEGEEP